MFISDKAWTKYIALLRRVNDKAANEMHKYLATHNWWVNNAERQAAIDFAFALATKYGEAAAEAACEFYDIIAQDFAYGVIPAAEPAATATYREVANAVTGTMKTNNPDVISSAVGRAVKMAGVDTTMKNAIRDGAEVAWIPRGDTCAFCIALASRGWQKASTRTIRKGHAEHVHPNCDCTYAVRFDRVSRVEGYDEKKYENMYYNTDPDAVNPKQRINAMRRAFYAENKEEINAQKRSAYAKRQELEASSAEETDVN